MAEVEKGLQEHRVQPLKLLGSWSDGVMELWNDSGWERSPTPSGVTLEDHGITELWNDGSMR